MSQPRLYDYCFLFQPATLEESLSSRKCTPSGWRGRKRSESKRKLLGFGPGSVITLGLLGSCIVDLVFQIGGLADLQALCVHKEDDSGTELLGFGLPREPSILGGAPDHHGS
jgi:hypothetical protein